MFGLFYSGYVLSLEWNQFEDFCLGWLCEARVILKGYPWSNLNLIILYTLF